MERVNWNQAVRPSTHDLIAAINSGADDIDRIDGALDDIETALDGKAGVSGTYPDFVAGEALSIRSGIRSNTFLTRALDTDVADGIAEISRVLGNTVVWNQLAELNVPTSAHDGVTMTANADGSVTINGTATARSSVEITIRLHVDNGHKYILRGCPANGSTSTFYLGISGIPVDTGNGGIWTSAVTADNYTVRFDFFEGQTFDNVKIWAMCTDLTILYGAGNEPQTVAEFEAQYPADYYAYSAPTLLSSTIAGIEGASSCEFPAQTLRGIGTAQDVMTRAGITRVIGQVDLGSLTWTYTSGENSRFTSPLNDAKRPAGGGILPDFKCAELTPDSTNNIYNHVTDKTIGLHTTQGTLWVYDSAYTDVATFKAAMSGVILQYELATPTTEPFAEPLDLTYRVESGGTEAWIVPEDMQSAAVTGEIAYPLDPARALITHESFADFCDKLGAYLGATITETWDGSKYTYSFASGRSALLGSIEAEPDALEVTEKDDIVKEIIEDERKEL